jgi:transposase
MGHLACIISDSIDVQDLNAFYVRYSGGGTRNRPFHLVMTASVLVYGCATGVFSSRKNERRLHEDLAFRTLGACNFPKRRSIRDFRVLRFTKLSDPFAQLARIAHEMGLFELGAVAIDGGKIKANACRRKAINCKRFRGNIARPTCPVSRRAAVLAGVTGHVYATKAFGEPSKALS